jgi:hypothetical protein
MSFEIREYNEDDAKENTDDQSNEIPDIEPTHEEGEAFNQFEMELNQLAEMFSPEEEQEIDEFKETIDHDTKDVSDHSESPESSLTAALDSTHPDFDEAAFCEYSDYIDQQIEENPPTPEDIDRIERLINEIETPKNTDQNEEFTIDIPDLEPLRNDKQTGSEQIKLNDSHIKQEPATNQLEITSDAESIVDHKETPNRIWIPQIDDTYILNIDQLHLHLNTEYPGLKRNPAYAKALQDAEHHLTLYNEVKDHTHLPRGTLIELARKHDYPYTQVYEYVSRGKRPYLYRLTEDGLSKTEAQTRLTELHNKNTNLRSLTAVQRRLHTYYPHPLLETSPHYHKYIHQTEKYYAALELLKDGGTFADTARLLDLDERHVNRWFTGEYTPKLVQLARHIPQEPPHPGNKWLPTKLKAGHGFKPTNFIQVPEHVTHWNQIRAVTDQLHKLDTQQMQKWHQQFGPITTEHALAYILGMLLSDASKPKNSLSSAGFKLGLSKSYSWSKQVGEATCYYLGILGIEAKRSKDWENNRTWFSEHTPLVPWIMQSCMNIKDSETTTYNQIKAEYLYNASRKARIAFLHGVTDGDGIISTKWGQLGISTISNQTFLKEFLQTFNIESAIDKDRIRIKPNSFERATNLPFFRHATGRQENAEKLVKITKAQIENRYKPISKKIKDEICNLRKEGMSCGEIVEIIYDKYNLAYHPNKILRVVKKHKLE